MNPIDNLHIQHGAGPEKAHAADVAKATKLRRRAAEKRERWLEELESEAVSLRNRDRSRALARPAVSKLIKEAEQQGVPVKCCGPP